MAQEMSCCNVLSYKAKRAFICNECSKDRVVLCEDCSLVCHPLHELSEIKIAKEQTLYCDCGNSRAVQRSEICLLNSNKRSINTGNRYNFRLSVPKVGAAYYQRRRGLLRTAGPLYMNRAAHLAEMGYPVAAMKDFSIAIAWDPETVVLKILNLDLGAASPFLFEATTNLIRKIKSKEEDVKIMLFAEFADGLFKRVELTLELALQRTHGEDAGCLKVKLLVGAFKSLKDEVMEAVWVSAASAPLLNITSLCQFDLYKEFVLHRSVQMATLYFKRKDFKENEWSTVEEGHGSDYLIEGLTEVGN